MSQFYQTHGVGRMDDGKAARQRMAPLDNPASYNRTALTGKPGRREPLMRVGGEQPLYPIMDQVVFRVASEATKVYAPTSFNTKDLTGLPGKRELPPRPTTRETRTRAFDQYMGKADPAEEAVKYVPPEVIAEVRRLISEATGSSRTSLADMLEKLERGALGELTDRQQLIYGELMKQFGDLAGLKKNATRGDLEDEGVVFDDEDDDDEGDDDNDEGDDDEKEDLASERP